MRRFLNNILIILIVMLAIANPAMAQMAQKYLPVNCQEPETRLETKLAYPYVDGQPNFTGTLVKVGYDCPTTPAAVFSMKTLGLSLTNEEAVRTTAKAIHILVAMEVKPELAAELLRALSNPNTAQAIAMLSRAGIDPNALTAAMTSFSVHFTKAGG